MLKVAGGNIYGQLCSESNNRSANNFPIVSPPVDSNLKISSLLSYSVYCDHSVWVTKKGKARGIGDNSGGRIHGSLPKEKISKWTEFEIKDKQENQYDIQSAVCGLYYTLYLVKSNNGSDETKLAYVFYNKNGGMPLFLDTGDKLPVALFGGYKISASINNDGSVSVVNKTVFDSHANSPLITMLPNNERAINVACCDSFIVVLSSTGRTYSASLSSNGEHISEFEEVESLKGIKIVQISGTFDFCLAVTDDERVFRCETGVNGIESFVEISSLKNEKVYAVYGGYNHSLFQTKEGKIIAYGNNEYGQLLNKTGFDIDENASFIETSIVGGATFCIAGYQISCVYIIIEPPSNSPNREILNIRGLSTYDSDNFNTEPIANDLNKNQSRCCLLI